MDQFGKSEKTQNKESGSLIILLENVLQLILRSLGIFSAVWLLPTPNYRGI